MVVDVFPVTGYDRSLLNGYKAQVWIEPGVSATQTRKAAAKMYRGAGYDHPGDRRGRAGVAGFVRVACGEDARVGRFKKESGSIRAHGNSLCRN